MKHFFHSLMAKAIEALSAQNMLLLAPLFMGFGIVVYYGLWLEPPLILSAILFLGWVVLTIIMRRQKILVVMLAAAFMLFGFTLAAVHSNLQQRKDIAPSVRADIVGVKFMRGEVIAIRSSSSEKTAAIFKVMEIDGKPTKDFLVRLTDSRKLLGDYATQSNVLPLFCDMTIKAKIFLLPLKKSLSGYDIGRDWYFHGYRASGQLLALPHIDAGCDVTTSRSLGQTIKNNIIKNYPPDVAGMVLAMITGERSGIDPELMEQYRQSGLIHLISISGVHMGLIAGIAFLLIRFLLVVARPNGDGYLFKKIAAFMAMAITICYFLLAEYSSASLRAVLMTTVVFTGVMLGRRAISLENLALSMMLVLCYRSVDIFNPGFQLSFTGMLVLVGLYEKFWKPLATEIEQGIFYRQPATNSEMAIFMGPPAYTPPRTFFKKIEIVLFALLISSTMVTLAILPISLFHFHEASLFGVVANMAAIPLMDTVAMPLLFVKVFAMPLTNIVGDFYPLDWAITKIFRMLNWLAIHVHGGEKFLIRGGGFGLTAIFLYGVGFYLLVMGGRDLKKIAYVLLAGFLLLAIINPKPLLVVSGLEDGGRMKWTARFDGNKNSKNKNKDEIWVSPYGNSFVRRLWADEYGIKQFEKNPPPPAICSRAICYMEWRDNDGNKKFTATIIGNIPPSDDKLAEVAESLCKMSDMVIGKDDSPNMALMKKTCPDKIQSADTASIVVMPRILQKPSVQRITLRRRPWITAAVE